MVQWPAGDARLAFRSGSSCCAARGSSEKSAAPKVSGGGRAMGTRVWGSAFAPGGQVLPTCLKVCFEHDEEKRKREREERERDGEKGRVQEKGRGEGEHFIFLCGRKKRARERAATLNSPSMEAAPARSGAGLRV